MIPIQSLLSNAYTQTTRFYPTAFRRSFAPEMQWVFELALHEAAQDGALALSAFGLREFAGLLRSIGAEWLHELRRRPQERPEPGFPPSLPTPGLIPPEWAPQRLTCLPPVLRRALDLLAATLLLVLFGPVILAVLLAVRCDSPGPVLYCSTRVGKGGRTFTLYKIRSMALPSHLPAGAAPQRITRAGRLLRRFYLDEIPQLVNVLKGELSLIGPRPQNVTGGEKKN